ncbi:MAG: hypothetical protein LBM16_00415 [Clostridiales bacterium]|jgi:hypothetical protein|nr:hypothetical protein [Clostridiales bacterium]
MGAEEMISQADIDALFRKQDLGEEILAPKDDDNAHMLLQCVYCRKYIAFPDAPKDTPFVLYDKFFCCHRTRQHMFVNEIWVKEKRAAGVECW